MHTTNLRISHLLAQLQERGLQVNEMRCLVDAERERVVQVEIEGGLYGSISAILVDDRNGFYTLYCAHPSPLICDDIDMVQGLINKSRFLAQSAKP